MLAKRREDPRGVVLRGAEVYAGPRGPGWRRDAMLVAVGFVLGAAIALALVSIKLSRTLDRLSEQDRTVRSHGGGE